MGNEGKKYEGFWENGFQKGLGKYSKKDGSYKLGIWENSQITDSFEEKEAIKKIKEIEYYVKEVNSKVDLILERLTFTFNYFVPNIDIKNILDYETPNQDTTPY